MTHDDHNTNTYKTEAGRIYELTTSYTSVLPSKFKAIWRNIETIYKIENRKKEENGKEKEINKI